jgi:hypothetical protein
VWELLAILGFGSPKMLAANSSTMLGLGCSGGGAQMWDLADQSHLKLRVKPHVRGASIGSKWMRGIKVLIVGISLLKWSKMITLSFLGTRRGRSLVWI